MESGITKESKNAVEENLNVVKSDSADSFQSFIYELFEKNGVLNDLRAYLRGHIVNVLKSAQTGDPLPCQKKFTQRLDLTYQALNMLVAEYLMRLEFSYSFSVFVSEIPLANMVFGFAKSLFEKTDKFNTDLRFKDTDVWSILNYLGVQCDSEQASKIVQMYNNEKQNPLLLCILKGMPMFKECVEPQQSLSEDSLASSKSADSVEVEAQHKKHASITECSHSAYCKKCQNKLIKLKDKYRKTKEKLVKHVKNKESTNVSPVKSENLLRNISVTEKNLVEEMFQQLKSVYETEVEMLRVQEQKTVRRSIATHAMQLMKKQNEMEETFKAREVELERSVQHKKKFLWGLARSLRDQHQHMTRAMCDVRAETERLERKEDSLKTQLAEVEQILKRRGEEMRSQITKELSILESHLESMKSERENITRERLELENLKTIETATNKVIEIRNLASEEVHSHYDLLKNELAILKTYLKSSQMQAKCVIERGTVTEPIEEVSQTNLALNNCQGNEKCSKSDEYDDRLKMNQVVNDFRKKNVNFSQSNLDEIYRERSRDRSRSSNSSEAGDAAAPDLQLQRARDRDLIQRLTDENDRLKAFATQRCPHACARPHTAPARAANNVRMFNFNSSLSASTLNVGWRKGAGEELSMFSNAQPRILVPGDTLPFIGVLRDRHGNNRRPQLGWTGACRPRAALAGVSKRTVSPYHERHATGAGSSGQPARAHAAGPAGRDTCAGYRDQLQQHALPIINKSPKSLPKETKDKLLRKIGNKGCTESSRDKSPTAVLREAKQRLRKLEIEAEAVEKSYLAFRRRQSERPQRRPHTSDGLAKALDVTRSQSPQTLDVPTKTEIDTQFADLQKSVRGDFEKYMRDYKTNFGTEKTHFRNTPTVIERVKPISDAYVLKDHVDSRGGNYLETPLTEFRKLYTSDSKTPGDDTEAKSCTKSLTSDNARNTALQKVKHNRRAELQILKENINKMYERWLKSGPAPTVDQVTQNFVANGDNENKLIVEVESVNDVKSTQDVLLVVESSINSGDVTISNQEVCNQVFAAEMTVIVSPKRPATENIEAHLSPERAKRSLTPEQAANLTRNDVLDAIFHADPNNDPSSVQMELELAKDEGDFISEYEKENSVGSHSAEFVADVDNYNTQSDDDNSPISLPAIPTAEDENFWEA